jgi:pyruvate dehydrogenase E2 component (dihydrolipoamide acetyltransferase)
VTLELSAPEDGVLVEILAPAGSTVPAGAAVCEFVTKDEGRSTKDREQETGDRRQKSASGSQLPVSVPAERAVRQPASGPLNATPKARALARELGVDLTDITGSGPEGRVQVNDVEAAHAAAQPTPIKATPLARRIAASEGVDLRSIAGTGAEGMITREDVEQAARRQGRGDRGQEFAIHDEPSAIIHQPSASTAIPHSSLRRTIAERMSQSAFTAPQVTLMTEAEATNLVSARAQLNQELPAADKISYNTLLVALTARALREHPNVNARWEADGIRLLAEINIALAVDTERGLMTPVLREVDKLSLNAVQRGYGELADRALTGKSLTDDFAGGTFTLTNLGGLDVDGFTPIINPPQAAILGVGRIIEKPVACDGAVVIRPMITLSLTFDHRIVDGAPAAKFLQRVKQLVERPMALLLG